MSPFYCAICGIHLFSLEPRDLERHAEHGRVFELAVKALIYEAQLRAGVAVVPSAASRLLEELAPWRILMP